MQTRILVTGSAGFVGSRLLEIMAKRGIKPLEADKKNGVDLTDPASYRQMRDVDVVVHLAAITSVPASFEDPRRFLYTNYNATLGALEICRASGARMIHMSSYLYGTPNYLPIDERHPLAPHNPYAQSKLVCEELCVGYQRDFGVPVTIFRPFNLYGPGLRDNSLIPTIIRQLSNGVVEILDPEPKRDYLYVDDLCSAVMKAIEHGSVGVEVYNLGSGVSVSVRDLAIMIISQGGIEVSVNVSNKRRKGEVMDCVADVSKAANELGWIPHWSLPAGINSTLDAWGVGNPKLKA